MTRVRMTTGMIAATIALCVTLGVLLGVVAQDTGDHRAALYKNLAREVAMVRAWNDMIESFKAQTPYLEELQESLKNDPPRRVRSERRLELYKQIIAEQKRQLHDFETMQKEESR